MGAVVFPELEAEAATEALWGDVIHVCRLDEPDPVAAWRHRIDEIWRAASRLDELDLDALHFVGPGTDLTVGLLPSSRFAKEGGSSTTRTGIRHVPNLPTEELYTTPDPERTEGYVASTKPLDVGGTIVQGLRVRFEAGRAVEIKADANAEALRRLCATDEGAARLGEVALVDGKSRIGQWAERSSTRSSTRTRRATSRWATRTPPRSRIPPTCRESTRARCTSTLWSAPTT